MDIDSGVFPSHWRGTAFFSTYGTILVRAVFTLAKCYLAQNVSVGKLLQLFAKFASLDFGWPNVCLMSARSAAVATFARHFLLTQ